MHDDTRTALLDLGGEPLSFGGNETLRLDQEPSVWLIEAGKVELFAVHTDEAARGPRTHVATLDTGQVLFGIRSRRRVARPFGHSKIEERPTALLAVGSPDTRLLRFPIEALVTLARESHHVPDLAEAIEGWLIALFRKVPRAEAPKRFDALGAGSEIELPSGGVARTADGVVWVRHVAGRSRFLGRDELVMAPSGFLLPLSDETWLTVEGEEEDEGPGAVLSSVATENLVRSGAVWEGLARFHDLFLDYVGLVVDATRDQERQRLTRRRQMDRSMLTTASRRLASVLEPDLATSAFDADPSAERDALIDACRLVGEAQGFVIRAPKEPRGQTYAGTWLTRIGAVSRLRYRRVILRDSWWTKDNGPLLAFRWDSGEGEERYRMGGRPVALMPVSATRYELIDPTTEERLPIDAEVAGQLEGEAFMFYSPLPERAVRLVDLARMAVRGRRRDLVTIGLMGSGAGLLGLLVPLLTAQIFGTVIPAADRDQLTQMAIALAFAALATLGFHLTRAIAVLRLSGKLDGSVQAAVWDRLLALPVHFFKRYTVGDLASRSMGIDQIRMILLGNVTTSLLAAIFSVFSFALLFYFNATLALVATGMVAFLLLVTGSLVYLQVRHQRSLLELEGKVASLLFGLLGGVQKLRIAGAEHRGFARWSESYGEQRRIALHVRKLANLQATWNAAYSVFSVLGLFAMMGLTLEAEMSLSEFLAFNAAFGQFQAAALSLIGLFSSLLTIVPLYERLKPILDTPPEVDDGKSAVDELSGDIELSHVAFRYQEDGPLILDDVTLHASPGEMIALVGPSGSGKSTILRLILGFEEAEAGSIYFDGQDLASIDVQAVRRQMGVVLQSGKPIAGSIFSNIVGNSNLTIDDAWEAARMSGLDEDINTMPMGMHTIISEGGGTFSGGQQQRLLIARAIVHRPRILLFDEATSALDNRTQEIVSQSLERLKATRIVVAHRLSTIRNADRIFVLVKGRVEESGTYDELMDQGGVFARLAARQIA
ncbi:MAG: NHLP bacteriocin export ABC transporter permease/ATPase subunit [Acidobacteriota bacterium]